MLKIIKYLKNKKKKEDSEFFHYLNKYSKVDECILCHKKMSSSCKSHVVPQFILKNISENGKVAYGISLSNIEINGFDKETGIKNAHTFRLICNECDNHFFKDYENKKNLISFDNLSKDLKIKVLCEMAIKTRISHINMKYRTMVMKDMFTGGKLAEKEEKGEIIFGERVDMEDHFKMIDIFRQNIYSNKNPFHILFNELLDYKVLIASQTIVNYNFDLDGNKIFDPYNVSYNNICNYFYIMILPFEDKTRIMFYVENEKMKNVESIINGFNSLSYVDKLKFIFISLVIHDEQFYLNPNLANYINMNDKKLKKLYIKSEKNLKYTNKIKDFRKYNNYLSDKSINP